MLSRKMDIERRKFNMHFAVQYRALNNGILILRNGNRDESRGSGDFDGRGASRLGLLYKRQGVRGQQRDFRQHIGRGIEDARGRRDLGLNLGLG